ncbi:MAG: hypothetical protein R3B70_46765 [Polyangiaceae bacterium]
MRADWFTELTETAVNKVEAFERAVKKKFIEEPGQMKLLIVVDKPSRGSTRRRPPSSTSTSRCATTDCSRRSAA